MRTLRPLLEHNRTWAARMRAQAPKFFERHAEGQRPNCLWIGCSDSRVPPNEITGLGVGELFVHRNVGNVVSASDPSAQVVLEFAVHVLKVRHVIVCGHTRCGGVEAALRAPEPGPLHEWVEPIRTVARVHAPLLARVADDDARADRLAALNVVAQVRNVCSSAAVQAAWKDYRPVFVCGWMYELRDGTLRDLGLDVSAPWEVEPACATAVSALEKV